MKNIKYYRKVQYGLTREFVHPDCAFDAKVITALTGQKTIDSRIRGLFCDLFGGSGNLVWEEVIAP